MMFFCSWLFYNSITAIFKDKGLMYPKPSTQLHTLKEFSNAMTNSWSYRNEIDIKTRLDCIFSE